MEFHDRVLKCSECGAEFVFTAGEQMFFADKGFKNEPKRCKACKAKRAEGGGGGGGSTQARRNKNDMLAMRKRDHGSFPTDAGSPGILPGMLPSKAVHGRGVKPTLTTETEEEGYRRDSPFLF